MDPNLQNFWYPRVDQKSGGGLRVIDDVEEEVFDAMLCVLEDACPRHQSGIGIIWDDEEILARPVKRQCGLTQRIRKLYSSRTTNEICAGFLPEEFFAIGEREIINMYDKFGHPVDFHDCFEAMFARTESRNFIACTISRSLSLDGFVATRLGGRKLCIPNVLPDRDAPLKTFYKVTSARKGDGASSSQNARDFVVHPCDANTFFPSIRAIASAVESTTETYRVGISDGVRSYFLEASSF